VLDEASLAAFCAAAWKVTGLIRVRLRTNGATDPEPVALHPDATLADVAERVHHDLAASFGGARVWGSARFEGQRVGRDHPVQGGDVVEILR
jgi:ribosome-interacting GTPase 1